MLLSKEADRSFPIRPSLYYLHILKMSTKIHVLLKIALRLPKKTLANVHDGSMMSDIEILFQMRLMKVMYTWIWANRH